MSSLRVSLKTLSNTVAQYRLSRLFSTEVLPNKWQLFSAVCMERIPVISQNPTELEERVMKLMNALEFENSCLSDHELLAIEDQKLVEKRKRDDYEETEADAVRLTANELEDLWETEGQNLQLAPRSTAADESNDVHSLNRKLDRKLVLLVKQKLGDGFTWVLPQHLHTDATSLRQTAELALQSLCGDQVQGQILGNAPVGFLKYTYPKEQQKINQCVGAKVFFFKAQHIKGNLKPGSSPSVQDFAWITKDDFTAYFRRTYRQKLKFFIEL